MVESAFNPMAYSRAHASGLWQFIPGTGRRFELEQNSWYDGRRDIVDSTSAALDYLTKLYEMHGDWHLALASYNWGENAVKKAVARNRAQGKKTDYASLRMPKETRHYIPKLQALENIIADPAAYGVDLDAIPNQPYFTVITDTPDIDVHLAARLAEMPVEDFIALNPGFSRPLIRSSSVGRIIAQRQGGRVLRQPRHPRRELAGVMAGLSPEAGREARGDRQALRHQRERAQARERHSPALDAHAQGPRRAEEPRSEGDPRRAAAHVRAADPQHGPARAVHVVKRGDTLSSIARRYRVSVASLKSWNQSAVPAGRPEDLHPVGVRQA